MGLPASTSFSFPIGARPDFVPPVVAIEGSLREIGEGKEISTVEAGGTVGEAWIKLLN